MTGGGPARIAVCFAIWSTWSIFIRWLSIPGWAITFYVGAVSCTCVALIWAVQGLTGKRQRGIFPPEHVGALLVMGLLFLSNNVLYLTSVKLTTVANAIFSHYLAPVLVGVGAPIFLKEKRLRSAPFGLLLATAGMALLVGPGMDANFSGTHLTGIILGAISAVAYAALVLMSRRYAPRLPALSFIFYLNLVVAAGVAPWLLFTAGSGGSVAFLPTERDWWMLAVLGAVHATAAGSFYVIGIRRTSAQLAAILGYIEPLGAVALAALLLDERVSLLGLAGGGLILLGGGLAAWEEATRQKPVEKMAG